MSITAKIKSLVERVETERAKYEREYNLAESHGDNSGLVNGEIEEFLKHVRNELKDVERMLGP